MSDLFAPPVKDVEFGKRLMAHAVRTLQLVYPDNRFVSLFEHDVQIALTDKGREFLVSLTLHFDKHGLDPRHTRGWYVLTRVNGQEYTYNPLTRRFISWHTQFDRDMWMARFAERQEMEL